MEKKIFVNLTEPRLVRYYKRPKKSRVPEALGPPGFIRPEMERSFSFLFVPESCLFRSIVAVISTRPLTSKSSQLRLGELLEARITSERIEHRIEPEERRRERHARRRDLFRCFGQLALNRSVKDRTDSAL
jgi:hypothetical protein